MAANSDFPCSLVLDVPFPTPRLANIALQALSVDKELSPSVRRSFSIKDDALAAAATTATTTAAKPSTTVLRVAYEATTNRMLRVSVNAFLDSVGLVVDVMEGLDVDVLEAEADSAARETQPAAVAT